MSKSIVLRCVLTCLFFLSSLSLLSIPAGAEQAAAANGRNPIVLVHGIGGAGFNFASIERALINEGYSRSDLYAIDFLDKSGNNITNSRQLSSYIDDVLRKTGASKVDIIAHSMGGANTLYYINNLGGGKNIGKVITLGSPNRLVARSAPTGIAYTSIYSTSDLIVNNTLSPLNGANNIRIFGVTHIGLLIDRGVQSHIMNALK
ncbi:triacylglycerol lipase [Paenibacillus sp. OK076]|uniref:esterase/lipase family protein n=1 Tax=Paenibacillus sp. OK076 TaxID=1884379 RepID=UPI0008D8CC0E|nr:alpha/beta fold hydrolase [Paenibacillus sp. OK076]SEO93146.1 triacylglycerol lipase [Paenibacillus sp. OK076]